MKHTHSSFWKKFDENKLTHSIAHYLFAIHALTEENGYARGVDIAKTLDITAGSCSIWLKWLLKKKFITEDKNKFIRLTKDAEWLIEEIKENRKTFKNFFIDELWIEEEAATINACKIEHLIDSEVTKKLKKYMKK